MAQWPLSTRPEAPNGYNYLSGSKTNSKRIDRAGRGQMQRYRKWRFVGQRRGEESPKFFIADVSIFRPFPKSYSVVE